jgi:hypothetical protein
MSGIPFCRAGPGRPFVTDPSSVTDGRMNRQGTLYIRWWSHNRGPEKRCSKYRSLVLASEFCLSPSLSLSASFVRSLAWYNRSLKRRCFKYRLLVLASGFCSSFSYLLVWTLCLMHRCVCIWWYILQNYNYKLHFQNLFIYDIWHVSIGTLAVENLDVCTTCDPWNSNIRET